MIYKVSLPFFYILENETLSDPVTFSYTNFLEVFI